MSAYERWKQEQYEALQARMDADAAERHAARMGVKEAADARLRAAIDEAVRVAVQGLLAERALVAESAPLAPPEVPAAVEVIPPHEMEPSAWQAHASRYWADRMTPKYQPMTMSEFLTSQPDDDGAA